VHCKARHLTLALMIFLMPSVEAGEFIYAEGQQFRRHDQDYFFVGCNYWYGLNLASAGPGGDRQRLNRELDFLVDLGVRNLRVMAGSEGPNDQPWRIVPALQTAPGIYDSEVLDGLDYLLYAMKLRGLYAVMCLSNFWHWSGGLSQYVNWNGGGPIPYPPPEPGGDWNIYQDYASDFYSNPAAKQDYLDHFAFLATHVNPYTGLDYMNEPTIMSWELANEPRGFHNNEGDFNLWIDDTAAYIKSLDINHLVTVGCEGDTPWPEWNGLDFTANHDSPDIDYTTLHIWPENWGWYDPTDPEATYATAESNARAYFTEHVVASMNLNKPIVLEEFGLARDGGSYDPATSTVWRDVFLAAMFGEIYDSASEGGPAVGDNFWAWAGEGRPSEPFGAYWQPGDPWTGDPPHEHQGWYGIYDQDVTTLDLVSAHATAMMDLMPPTAVNEPGSGADPTESLLRLRSSPAIGRVHLKCVLPENRNRGQLEIFDVTGRRLARHEIFERTTELNWSGSEEAHPAPGAGVYLARLSWKGGESHAKFVFFP